MSRKMQGQAFQQGIDSERQPGLTILQVATPITGRGPTTQVLIRKIAARRRQAAGDKEAMYLPGTRQPLCERAALLSAAEACAVAHRRSRAP